jgi:prophage antirepressor-like protein
MVSLQPIQEFNNAIHLIPFANGKHMLKCKSYGTTDNPLFMVNEFADFLEIKNVADTTKNYGPNYIQFVEINYNGKPIKMKMLTEKGLYRLIFQSDTKFAEAFHEYVTNILKTLRTKGSITQQQAISHIEENYSELLKEAQQQIKEFKEEIDAYKVQQYQLEDQRDKFKDKLNLVTRDAMENDAQAFTYQKKHEKEVRIREALENDYLNDSETLIKVTKTEYIKYLHENYLKTLFVYMIDPESLGTKKTKKSSESSEDIPNDIEDYDINNPPEDCDEYNFYISQSEKKEGTLVYHLYVEDKNNEFTKITEFLDKSDEVKKIENLKIRSVPIKVYCCGLGDIKLAYAEVRNLTIRS